MDDNLRITAWLKPSQLEYGKYGRVTNREWLEFEKDRFTKDGVKCEILSQAGKESLFRKPPKKELDTQLAD